ncbi:hypothetical protein AMECASPLE_036548, partial [Ameca splendens]
IYSFAAVLSCTCGLSCNCLVQCSTIPGPNLHTTDSETIHWGGLSTHTYRRHNHANPPGRMGLFHDEAEGSNTPAAFRPSMVSLMPS